MTQFKYLNSLLEAFKKRNGNVQGKNASEAYLRMLDWFDCYKGSAYSLQINIQQSDYLYNRYSKACEICKANADAYRHDRHATFAWKEA